ncbi:MAG: 16S rRNA (cytidine(1402)-2'-O)-methyltransferase [Xanthomonadales bacterium]|nr:16S rRNA (cytidine(1402)-2'-O)-methyltransferase [Xanthomonadales bacterium]
MLDPGLYVVATPIGNLQDITLRALQVLGDVELVAAEDTRRSAQLLNHHGLRAALKSVHEHNESKRIPELLSLIRNGHAVALISDAGTPLVSDPGFRLVQAVVEEGFSVYSVPGPSALTAAISVSGLASDRFLFEGFLPAKAAARKTRLEVLAAQTATLVFFESSHRILDSLEAMAAVFGGQRKAAVCRELTKQFETVLRGSLADVIETVKSDRNQRKGEFVVVVKGSDETDSEVDGLTLARALLEYLPPAQAARVAAKVGSGSRREIYAALQSE